ncbi:hypothetical protein [Cryobacterium sp. Y82]|uniref:hypothetical protein n=1 Tax=Cryobacterium sp. Y82 TaxID=2045017 RepID=UPI000CE44669|nr:hypothetical protein [Cryobacterium sp. Y82]
MTWFVCSISPSEPRNWALCKEHGLWGYTRGMPSAGPGDRLLFWMGKKGYVGFGRVTEPARVPAGRFEAPWSGGTSRFTAIVPMIVWFEVKKPLWYPFVNNVQTETGLNTGHFQRGMALVPDDIALTLSSRLVERALAESEEAREGDPALAV